MNGELAQAVAVVAHGNAALHRHVDLADFEARNSTFQFVRSVAIEVPARWRAKRVHRVEEWIRALRTAGVHRLSLIGGGATPVAFANEGGWGVMGHGARKVSAWYGHWEVNHDGVDPADQQPRIWEVTYRMFERNGSIPVAEADLRAAIEELLSALVEARDFAADDDYLTTFVELFDRARAFAEDEDPTAPYHDDLLPQGGYSTDARRLLAMASQAWVFGGMGSWNDVGFPDEHSAAEYRRVSERLYQGVVAGARVAANSFDPALS